MDSRNRRTAGVLALSALLASGVGLAGCGTNAATEAGTGADPGIDTTLDTSTDTSVDAGTDAGSDAGTEAVTDAGSSGEVECRRGIVNDPYPGLCRDYVDVDGNGICDLSESADSASAQAVLISLGVDTTSDDGTSGGCPLAPCSVCGICANLG